MGDSLTPRQREVAQLIARNMTAAQIGAELGISANTVRDHIKEAAARLPGAGTPKYRLLRFALRERPTAD